jgi:hypothetical protein
MRQLIINLTVRYKSLGDRTGGFLYCMRVNVEVRTVPQISKYKIRYKMGVTIFKSGEYNFSLKWWISIRRQDVLKSISS